MSIDVKTQITIDFTPHIIYTNDMPKKPQMNFKIAPHVKAWLKSKLCLNKYSSQAVAIEQALIEVNNIPEPDDEM